MRVHLLYVGPVVIGQAHDAVADAQLVFAHDGHAAVAQQFVVVEQAAGDGVLDGNDSHCVVVVVEAGEDLLEGVAADEFHLFVLEVAVGGDVVEAALDALYCYPSDFSHLFWFVRVL